MILEGNSGDKKTMGVDAENKLESVYKNKYRINLDHQILTDHGAFYPQALYNDLTFELTLDQAVQAVRGSDASKLVYKLKNIQLEYEVIRSKSLAASTYSYGKEFAYDLVMLEKIVDIARNTDGRLNFRVNPQRRSLKGLLLLFIVPYIAGARDTEHYDLVMLEKIVDIARNTDGRLNLRVNPQRRSLKGLLLLFIVPYIAGARDTEHYLNPDITKVSVTVNGSPNRVYNEGITGIDMWREASRFFGTKSGGRPNMNLTKYLTGNKFGLFIDLRSMADTTMHGNGQRLVNIQDGIQLAIERNTTGSGTVKCHVFSISDSQMIIMNKQLQSVQY